MLRSKPACHLSSSNTASDETGQIKAGDSHGARPWSRHSVFPRRWTKTNDVRHLPIQLANCASEILRTGVAVPADKTQITGLPSSRNPHRKSIAPARVVFSTVSGDDSTTLACILSANRIGISAIGHHNRGAWIHSDPAQPTRARARSKQRFKHLQVEYGPPNSTNRPVQLSQKLMVFNHPAHPLGMKPQTTPHNPKSKRIKVYSQMDRPPQS